MKVLTAEGLQHLWKQISLEDYPNNETLVAVLNAIDETKADKSDVTALQSLVGDMAVSEQISNAIDTIPQPDWNQNDETADDYIKNRTHYETTIMGDTLTWDGNTEGLDTYSDMYYRVSDVCPTMNDFVNGGTIKKSDGTITEFKNYHTNEDMGRIDIYMGDIYVFFTEQNGIPTGIYFSNLNGVYVTSLTINGYNGFETTEINQLDPKYIPDSVKTHDWNTLENRPFGEEVSENIYIEEQTVEFVQNGSSSSRASVDYLEYIPYDAICKVYFDGVLYDNIAAYESQGDMCVYVDFTTENGEQISICESSSISAPASYIGQKHTIKVTIEESVVTPIENKYLGIPVVSGAGDGSLCFNDTDNNKASGAGSHAEGWYTEASGYCSHAEGNHTEASGWIAHAEGYGTEASGNSSHAEGSGTEASGKYSHAEGISTTASGDSSHAEGYGTEASNKSQHVAGEFNIINNEYTYMEFIEKFTTAKTFSQNSTFYLATEYTCDMDSGEYQLINQVTCTGKDLSTQVRILKNTSGSDIAYLKTSDNKVMYRIAFSAGNHGYKYNSKVYIYSPTVHTLKKTSSTRGDYVHITGNGTSHNQRSNAHTLDWSGNAWYQGDVYVGSTSGTNRDEGSKKLATIPTDEEMVELLMDTGIVDPAANSAGAIYTDNNGNLYTL